ncbi:MAG TPA: oligosaccharide flippase family protein, partial [Pseudothermotoga sp.]
MIQYLKSFFSFSIGTWLRAVISFFSTPVISYLIVPEEFGKAAMFTLVYNIAFIASLMGLDQSFVRHYYQNEEKKELFWNCLSLPIVSGIVISLAFVFFESPLSLALYGKNYPQMGLLFSISLMIGIFQRFNQLSVRMQKRGFLYSMLDVVNSLGNAGGTIVFALTVSKSFYAIVF